MTAPRIYINDNLEGFDLEKAMKALPEYRLEKIRNLKFDIDRKQSAAAYLLLQKGLERDFGITDIPEFAYTEKGKPYLPDMSGIHFNLSHCRGAAACIIAEHPVGIDIEKIMPHEDELMRHVLSDSEYDSVLNSENPEIEFLKLWTVKESCLKLTGEGLTDNIKHLLPMEGAEFHTVVNVGKGYVYTASLAIPHAAR